MYVGLKPILPVWHIAASLTDGEGINPRQVIILEQNTHTGGQMQRADLSEVEFESQSVNLKGKINPK